MAKESKNFKIMSMNLWFTNSGSGWKDLNKGNAPWSKRIPIIQNIIKKLDPDVICFQEVLMKKDVLDMLSDIFGPVETSEYKHRIFQKTIYFWLDHSYDYGNAMISKTPIHKPEEVYLPYHYNIENSMPRGFMSGLVSVDGVGKYLIGNTHLNHRSDHAETRLLQSVVISKTIKDRVKKSKPAGVVLCGDFNAKPLEASILFLKGMFPVNGISTHFIDSWEFKHPDKPGYTWSSKNTNTNINMYDSNERFDYIFVSEYQPNGVGLIEKVELVGNVPTNGIFPSDHFGLFVVINKKPK